MNLTHEQKLFGYRNGLYRFKAPPVCTANWNTESWIKWIDACDGWFNIAEADEASIEDLETAAEYYDRLKGE